jgi:inhibitor of KinA
MSGSQVKFVYASDHSLLVSFGEEISLAAHQRVIKLFRLVQSLGCDAIRNLHPAYCSLLVKFDPCQTEHSEIESILRRQLDRADTMAAEPAREVEISVCYGGEFGPDLDLVAAHHGMTRDEVIHIHAGKTYVVYFLGFVPGFAYLGGMADSIAMPRLESPRRQVPQGSVGIAGNQTGIYPFSTPGGWRLIGRTPYQMFQAERANMSLLDIGDQVRFRPISRDEFTRMERTEK